MTRHFIENLIPEIVTGIAFIAYRIDVEGFQKMETSDVVQLVEFHDEDLTEL